MIPASVAPASVVAGLAWPALPPPAGRTLLAAQFQLERSQWWRPEDLAARQLEQLRELAAFVLDQVPHYRALIREHIPELMANPRALTWAQFARWPVLEKSALREREAALRPPQLPPGHGEVFWAATTGSTGMPVTTGSTLAAQFLRSARVMRGHLWHGLDFSLKYAEITPEAPRIARYDTWGPAPAAAFATGPAVALNVIAPLEEQLAWLIAEAPGYVQAKGSNLRALLLRSREAGRKPKGLKALLTYSENIPADLRELAREIWDVKVIDSYSCSEGGMLALQCPRHEHFHAQSELVHVEVLDAAGRPCPPGGVGRVVFTELANFAMPLIRYALGDYAQVGAPCDCGRGLPVLARIMGRTRNMATDPTGRVFWPTFPGKFWVDVAPIRQVQVVQHEPQALEVRYVMERQLSAAEQSTIASSLAAHMGYAFGFRFTRIEAIARKPGEKFEDFICHCLPPAA